MVERGVWNVSCELVVCWSASRGSIAVKWPGEMKEVWWGIEARERRPGAAVTWCSQSAGLITAGTGCRRDCKQR